MGTATPWFAQQRQASDDYYRACRRKTHLKIKWKNEALFPSQIGAIYPRFAVTLTLMEGSAASKTEFSERRRQSRIERDYDVDIVMLSGDRAGDQITGKIVNISKGGVGITVSREILIGIQVGLTIYSDEDQTLCSGNVVWKKEIKGEMVFGVKILHWAYIDGSIESDLPH